MENIETLTYDPTNDDLIKIKASSVEELKQKCIDLSMDLSNDKGQDAAASIKHQSLKSIILKEIELRNTTMNNKSGIVAEDGLSVNSGDILIDKYQHKIVIDFFGAHYPGCYSYIPYGASNLTAHYPLFDITKQGVVKDYRHLTLKDIENLSTK